MAFLTMMLGQVIDGMYAFMCLLAAAVLFMAFALMLLRPDAEEFSSFGSSIFTTYALLMFADGAGERDLYQVGYVLPYLLMITMLLVAIIMLNALIAIMSDNYDKVSETRLERGLRGRALLLIEIEEGMTKDDHKNQALFPRWLHVIKRADDSEEGGAEWSGRLRAIKDSVSKVAKTVNGVGERIGAMEGTLNKVMEKQEVSQRFHSIETKLDMRVGAIETTLDTRVGAIEAQLNKIIAQLLLAVPASAPLKPSWAEANPTWPDGPVPPPIAKLQSWAASIVSQNKK